MSTWNDALIWAMILFIICGLYLAFLRARTWYYKRCPFEEKKEYYKERLSFRENK